MNKFFRGLRKKLMKGKFCINRTMTYVSIINSGMILFLFLSKLKDSGAISLDLDKYYWIIFLIGLSILFGIGWIDIHLLKAIQEERNFGFYLSPPQAEMKKQINDLWEDKYGKAQK